MLYGAAVRTDIGTEHDCVLMTVSVVKPSQYNVLVLNVTPSECLILTK